MRLSKKAAQKKAVINRVLATLGYVFIFFPLAILVRTFYPVAKAAYAYNFSPRPATSSITASPVDPQFSIIIPRININTRVIKNVDPYDSSQYQFALTQGVAHAKGSSLPGQYGNTFIFAHSAGNWYQANQYNAVFYLINKLKIGDPILIHYQGQKYTYAVSQTKIVKGDDVNYLESSSPTPILTLMTCWPPGTTLNRLIIIARPLDKIN